MEDHTESPDPQPAKRGRLQFGLGTLFLLMTVSAVLLAGLFAGPIWLTALVVALMLFALPSGALSGMIYGRGLVRTFFIGALIPAGVVLFVLYLSLMMGSGYFSSGLEDDSDPSEVLLAVAAYVGIPYVMSLGSGLVAVTVRRMVEGPRGRAKRTRSA